MCSDQSLLRLLESKVSAVELGYRFYIYYLGTLFLTNHPLPCMYILVFGGVSGIMLIAL